MGYLWCGLSFIGIGVINWQHNLWSAAVVNAVWSDRNSAVRDCEVVDHHFIGASIEFTGEKSG